MMNKNIIAPLPGTVIEILVHPGDRVSAGQTVAVLEAMKMENELLAEYSGRVVSVNVSEGERVPAGTEIITVE
jgi:biotin carboxyl carrier protein